MTVRAKFVCNAVTDFGFSKEVKLTAVHDTSTPENERFNKATPSGTLTMAINNPDASVQFKPGMSYYVDFSAAP